MTLDEQQALIEVYRKGHQSRIAPFLEAALTHWPALIEAHRKALGEIERLKAAGTVLARDGAPFENRDAWWEARKVFEENSSGT